MQLANIPHNNANQADTVAFSNLLQLLSRAAYLPSRYAT